MPRHMGIILDGNRRHGSQQRLTDPKEIYLLGARKLDDVLGWCSDLHIPAVTLWVLSTDNLARSADQVAGILSAIESKLNALAIDPRLPAPQAPLRAMSMTIGLITATGVRHRPLGRSYGLMPQSLKVSVAAGPITAAPAHRYQPQEQAVLAADEPLLASEFEVLAPGRIGDQTGAIGFVGRQALDAVDAIADRARALLRPVLANEVGAAARDRLSPVASILLERGRVERIDFVADEDRDRHGSLPRDRQAQPCPTSSSRCFVGRRSMKAARSMLSGGS